MHTPTTFTTGVAGYKHAENMYYQFSEPVEAVTERETHTLPLGQWQVFKHLCLESVFTAENNRSP